VSPQIGADRLAGKKYGRLLGDKKTIRPHWCRRRLDAEEAAAGFEAVEPSGRRILDAAEQQR